MADGVGLLTGQGITVIDLDDYTVAPYELSPEAQAFVESLDSWAEWSQSGCDIHINTFAKKHTCVGKLLCENVFLWQMFR